MTHRGVFVCVCVCVLAVLTVSLPVHADANLVQTTYGPVQGFQWLEVDQFLGIPFASPPVNDLRFKAPIPPKSWTSVKDVTTYPPICPQVRITGQWVIGQEDCLYLNMYRPHMSSNVSTELLPVMVWIYGGGYTFGDAHEFGFYDGTNLATKRNVIIVAMNYRLSAFGFLAHPSLKREDPDGSTGNYGVQDQRLALQWVHDNIKAFGGDPNQVTIFGESAGAFSVCWHLVSPRSTNFQAAISESGTCDATQFFQSYELATAFGDTYSTAMGCNYTAIGSDAKFLQCLRDLSTADVMTTILDMFNPNWPYGLMNKYSLPQQIANAVVPPLAPVMPFGPAIDKSQAGLLDLPLHLLRKNQFHHVPVLLGSNKDEGTIFVPGLVLIVPGVELPLNKTGMVMGLQHFFNKSVVNTIMTLYAGPQYKSYEDRCAHVLRDYFFTCANRRAARALSASGPVYLYQFTYLGDWIEDPLLGDYHSSELEFVWDNAFPPIIHAFSARDTTMANTFGTYWTNFAKSHNPNTPAKPPLTWPQYEKSSDLNMVLKETPVIQSGLVSDLCDFWDTLVV